MTKTKLIFFLAFFLINLNYSCFAENKSKIILKIENEIVTNFDLRNKILSTLILTNQEINQENINNIKNQSLDLIIQYKLKKIELSRYNFEADQMQVNSYLNSISSNNIQNLKDVFNKYNVDFEQFLDEVKIEFKWKKFIYKNYSKKIEIDDNIISEEIEKKIKDNNSLEQFKLSKIEIYLNNDETDKLKILNLQNYISNFGFESAIQKFDSTSLIDKDKIAWVSGNSLSKKLSETVKNLKVGQISEVIKFQDSVIVLKLLEKRKSKISSKDIQKLKKEIIDRKKNDLFGLYSSSHLSKLKNSSFISYK
tara:strand:+ start:5953 stop:6879 length:927 start_codon:yes stop_codon:yes gene_type:complete